MEKHNENWLTAGLGMALNLIVLLPLLLLVAFFLKEIFIVLLILIAAGAMLSIIFDL